MLSFVHACTICENVRMHQNVTVQNFGVVKKVKIAREGPMTTHNEL